MEAEGQEGKKERAEGEKNQEQATPRVTSNPTEKGGTRRQDVLTLRRWRGGISV